MGVQTAAPASVSSVLGPSARDSKFSEKIVTEGGHTPGSQTVPSPDQLPRCERQSGSAKTTQVPTGRQHAPTAGGGGGTHAKGCEGDAAMFNPTA